LICGFVLAVQDKLIALDIFLILIFWVFFLLRTGRRSTCYAVGLGASHWSLPTPSVLHAFFLIFVSLFSFIGSGGNFKKNFFIFLDITLRHLVLRSRSGRELDYLVFSVDFGLRFEIS